MLLLIHPTVFHPQRNDFLIGLHETNLIPFKSISAVSLSLEPSRDDGWLVIIVTVGASSFVFRHFKISVSSADHNCRCIGITYQFLRCVKVSGLYHHSFPKQKPPLTGKTYSNTTEEPPPQSF